MRAMRRRVTRPLPLWQKMIIVAWHRAHLAVLSPGACDATDPVSEYDDYRETDGCNHHCSSARAPQCIQPRKSLPLY